MTRLAVIGCGAIARRTHLEAFKTLGAEVTAFASRSLSSAEAARDEWGSGDATDDWRTVIERDDVDAVTICSPNAVHAEQTIAAAKAGKHVLVEKPMATTTAECDAMIAATDEAGVVLHIAHNMRYIGPAAAARAVLPRLGTIVGVRSAFGHGGPRRSWENDATWFYDHHSSGGGALIDMGIHAIDLLRYVTGLNAKTVSGMLLGTGDVEDAAVVSITFDNGAVGTVHASWTALPAPDFALTIFGTEGTVSLQPLVFSPASGEREKLEAPSETTSPFEDFLKAVRGEQPSQPATGADGRAAVAIAEAAYESARTKRTIDL